MNDTIINHCKPDGGGCSKCVSCKDPEAQKLCWFYVKAQYEERCTNIKFEAYCSCRNAYDSAMGKEVPPDNIPNKSTSSLFDLADELIKDLQRGVGERGRNIHNYDKFIDPPRRIPRRIKDYSRDPARHPSSLSHLSPKFADYIKRCEEKDESYVEISNPDFWIDSGGEHPEPFTLITAQDIYDNRWMPTESKFQRDVEHFYDMLEMPITIFPHHHLSVNPCAEVMLGVDNSGSISPEDLEMYSDLWNFYPNMEVEKLDMLFEEGRVMYHGFLGWYYDTQTEIFYDNQGMVKIPTERDLRRFAEDPFHDVRGHSYTLTL